MGIFNFFKRAISSDLTIGLTSNRLKLYEYYKRNNYNRIPEIPIEKECKRILEEMSVFPFSTVQKEYMKPLDSTGFIRGHIILLWWFNNPRTNKKNYPQYFLYEYGINPSKEKMFLLNQGYLDENNNLTSKGQKVIENYNEIIREHKALKTINSKGDIIYTFSDAERVKNETSFISTGDFIDDQFLGKAFEKNKDYENAIKAYRSAISISKERETEVPPNPYYRLAIIYRKMGNRDKEIEILKEGIKMTTYPGAKTTHDKLVERLNKMSKKR